MPDRRKNRPKRLKKAKKTEKSIDKAINLLYNNQASYGEMAELAEGARLEIV
jgi:hypothetical protein